LRPRGHDATPRTVGICDVFVKSFSALSQPPCPKTRHMTIGAGPRKTNHACIVLERGTLLAVTAGIAGLRMNWLRVSLIGITA